MPNSTSRDRILSRLYRAPKEPRDTVSSENGMAFREPPIKEKVERLKQMLELMRTEVHVCSENEWVEIIAEILRKKGLNHLLYSPGLGIGATLEKYWISRKDSGEILPELIPYEQNVEVMKDRLFGIDAAITRTKGAIVDDGAIILWPDKREPRTMSLIPPVHIAILKADTIYSNLSEVIEKENWCARMPTNAVLISGPSKTADIELILAFGVHGPKELILIILNCRR